jgi:hypothetical protein
MFRLTMQELLSIEQYFQRKFNKIKIKYILRNWGNFCIFWEAIDKWDFMEVI